MPKIKPRLLKGFRDFLPDELRLRKKVFKVFEDIFESYGYEPLQTPVLEYADILLGKYGEEEKLVYQFEDFGGRKVAMRYDQTVPTARVLAQYQDKIQLPWKRYQIQPVWRAENTQRGRFREFYQCDADVLGSDSMTADAEFISMSIEILKELGFKDFIIRLNNRKILNAIAKLVNAPDKFEDIVYAIDKWEKRKPAETKKDLIKRGLDEDQVDQIFSCLTLIGDTSKRKLKDLREKLSGIAEGEEGITELLEIIELVDNEKYLMYDPTIARGLTYYTGPVWEITVTEGKVGSVCGAGRYDKLIGSFLGRDIPATGGSFGVERIIEVLKDSDSFQLPASSFGVLVVNMPGLEKQSFKLAGDIRSQGIPTFLYPNSKKLGKQLEYADKKGFKYVVIQGEDEMKEGKILLKDMKKKDQLTIAPEEIEDLITL